MDRDDVANSFEQKLLDQLAAIDRRIAELQAERQAINRILARSKQVDPNKKEVNRRNSVDRIVVESRIVKILGQAGKPVKADFILAELRYAQISIKDATFRSHLHRLAGKGAIRSTNRGWWELPPSAGT